MNKYLAVALPLTVLLVVLAFFLPAYLSQLNDRSIIGKIEVQQTAEDGENMEELADSISLRIPEKMLLLRSGKLASMEIPVGSERRETGFTIEAETGNAMAYYSEELILAGAEDVADREEEAWNERLTAVLGELRGLQKIGALPNLLTEASAVEMTSRKQIWYMNEETTVGFLVNYMELSFPPYSMSLTVDDQTGKVMAFAVRWTKGSAPGWGIPGAANFGAAWRDYWGMDSINAAWYNDYTRGILVDTESMLRINGDYNSTAQLGFTYDGQDLWVPLASWAINNRGCSIQWNY